MKVAPVLSGLNVPSVDELQLAVYSFAWSCLIWKFTTVAYVGEDEVTSAEMMVAPETNKTSAKAPPA